VIRDMQSSIIRNERKAQEIAYRIRHMDSIEGTIVHVETIYKNTYIHVHTLEKDSINIYLIEKVQNLLEENQFTAHAVRKCDRHNAVCISAKIDMSGEKQD